MSGASAYGARLAAALGALEESLHVELVDVRQDAPPRGKRIEYRARYVHVIDCPPGSYPSLRFGSSTGQSIPVRPGMVLPAARGEGARAVFVEWTTLEAASEEGRYEIALAFSDDRAPIAGIARVETVPATATGGSTGQKTIAEAGTAEALAPAWIDTEAVMVTASPSNASGVTLGFSNAIDELVDGSGTGDVCWPGQTKVFPVDSPSRLFMNAQNTTDSVSWVCMRSRR